MDESFNPYLKWLGISLQDQPPNHYRLLGIPELIDDADVIDNAANRQMGHIRTFATGKHSQLSQQLLNEIAAAKVCLLSPAKKQAYDEQLRQAAARKAALNKPTTPAAAAQPVLQTRALPKATPLPTSQPAPVIAATESHSVTRRVKKKNSPGMLAAVALGLLVLAGIAIWRLGRSPSEEPSVAEKEPVVQSPASLPAETASVVDTIEPSEPVAGDLSAKTTEATPEKPVSNPERNSSANSENAATEQTVDLLKQVDILRDGAGGSWVHGPQILASTNLNAYSKMMLPGLVPKEYLLDMDVERLDGNNMLLLGLVVAGKQVGIFLDWHGEGETPYSSIYPLGNFPFFREPVFENGRKKNIRCRVTAEQLEVSVDGKSILDVQERMTNMSLVDGWVVPKNDVLFVGSYRSDYRFTKIELTPILNATATTAKAEETKTNINAVNLLKQIDLARDSVDGAWKLEGTSLISPTTGDTARIMLPGAVPKEYSLEMEVERLAGDNMLVVGLQVAGKQIELFFDWHYPGEEPYSGFIPQASFPMHRKPVFENGKTKRIRCNVTAKQVEVMVDGKAILDMNERLNELSLAPYWQVPKSDVLFVGSNATSFRISKMELSPINGNEAIAETKKPASNNKTVDLLKQVDLARDTVEGSWTLDKESLTSPANAGQVRLMLPGPVPKEYLLEMDVERLAGDNMLFVALMVAGKQIQLALDYHGDAEIPYSIIGQLPNFSEHRGSIFKNNRPGRIACRVTNDRVKVSVDGKTIFDVRDRFNEMSMHANWVIPNKDVLCLGAWGTQYRFTKLELTPLDGSQIAPTDEPNESDANEDQPIAKKLPLPAGSELEAAQASLREIFKDELAAAKSAEQQSSLAKTFLGQVTGDKQSPAEAYVLLNAAKTMAIKGADTDTALATIDKLAKQFEVDTLKLKAEALTDLAKAAKKQAEQVALIMAIGELVRELVEVDRFDEAEPLTKLAQSAAVQARNVQLRKDLAVSIKEFGELKQAYDQVQPAFEKLQTSPDDAAANLAVGRYRAFVRGNWQQGLKNLAAGNDETLRNVATKDLAGADNAADQVKLGDAWWATSATDASDKQASVRKIASLLRAGYWYGLALPDLTGLPKQHVTKRLDDIRALNPVGRINRDDWKVWAHDSRLFQDVPDAPLKFENGVLSLTSNRELALLVYQPFVSGKPFQATLEFKGNPNEIGLISADRNDKAILTNQIVSQEWHTLTINQLADKTIEIKIDNQPSHVRHWGADNQMQGKIAFWLKQGQSCSIRRFELKPTSGK